MPEATTTRSTAIPQEVDVILCGGGTAACIVAARLAQGDPKLSILVIEAGPNSEGNPNVIRPAMYLSHLVPDSKTATFYVAKPTPHVNNRNCVVPMGGTVGGGSAINFMMYTRPSASDWDDFEQEGWTGKEMIEFSKKAENFQVKAGKAADHGFNGPLGISYGGHQSQLGKQWVKASQDYAGIPFKDDIQDYKSSHNVTNWMKWINEKDGHRSDVAHNYLFPEMKRNENLHLVVETKVKRVIFEGKRASGVEIVANKHLHPDADQTPITIKARKMVIVSAGSLSSPQILERSGIGGKEILEKAGVPVVVDLPGVGENYQDHNLLLCTYHAAAESDTHDDFLRGDPEVHAKALPEWEKNGKGLMASNFIDAGSKTRPTEEEVAKMDKAFQDKWNTFYKRTDKPVAFLGLISTFLGDHSQVPPGKYFTAGYYTEYPFSKGSMHIKTDNPDDDGDFDAGFLSDPADMSPQIWAYKKSREIARRLPHYRGEFAAAHPNFNANSDARLRDVDAETSKAAAPDAIDAGVASGIGLHSGAGNAPNGANTNGREGGPSQGSSTSTIEDLKYTEEDDKAIEEYIRSNVATTWHSIGTNRMGSREEGGVVDNRLRVHGVEGLRIADLSISPVNYGSNTNGPAIAIGERAASLFAEDLGFTV